MNTTIEGIAADYFISLALIQFRHKTFNFQLVQFKFLLFHCLFSSHVDVTFPQLT
ncbi:MAG: hypothetical protein GY940_13955 [bacterium]|nr:hypothetical protein [bacterium]